MHAPTFLTAMTEEIQKVNPVDVIYVDFQKALDKVTHERLLLKLKAYGIAGKLLKWIRSFLKHRKQQVSVNGTESDWTEVMSGVPQGSVLGPIFFIVHINYQPSVLSITFC